MRITKLEISYIDKGYSSFNGPSGEIEKQINKLLGGDSEEVWEEKIVVDRKMSTVVALAVVGNSFRSKCEYYDTRNIKALLDNIGYVDDKPEALKKYSKKSEEFYTIKVEYSGGPKREISGEMRRFDLPKNWLNIVCEINKFLKIANGESCLLKTAFYKGELGDDEVRLARVKFDELSAQEYTYISDYELVEGDVVLVPVGSDNNEVEAVVVGVEVVKKADVKFDFELKRVILVIDHVDFDDLFDF